MTEQAKKIPESIEKSEVKTPVRKSNKAQEIKVYSPNMSHISCYSQKSKISPKRQSHYGKWKDAATEEGSRDTFLNRKLTNNTDINRFY